MDHLSAGLYEELVDTVLEQRLAEVAEGFVETRDLDSADAADRIALFLSREVERALADVPERDRASIGIAVLESLIDELAASPRLPRAQPLRPVVPGRVLHAVRTEQPDGTPRRASGPLIPLLDTALLTNSRGEPGVGSQVKAEIESADRIDLVMAFIRMSGIRPLLDELAAHCDRGGKLRVLTTTYTGSTEPAALAALHRIGAEVRVSYDTTSTRLHAKSWLFHRMSGFSTAYIGSSNLTHSAQVTGLEWNVRVSRARNRSIIEKVAAVFDTYWASGDFLPYDEITFRNHVRRGSAPTVLSPLEVTLRPFQERLLEQIAIARRQGRHKNLLAAATGTGKTVMAAADFGRLRVDLPRARLLFVAHREEILDQSLATFRHVLRDGSLGEKWVGGFRPTEFTHVFASIQSLNTVGIEAIPRDHFDVIIVDEFHHAAAPSYQALLEHVRPRELLGLTATPERSDGLDVLSFFDGRIAAELRLWDAIDQQYLAPFSYYGIHDNVDLTGVTWRRGRGYDVGELSTLFTGHHVRANLVIAELQDKIGDLDQMRALGFCVSVQHAEFMADHFRHHGIPSIAVSGRSSRSQRESALADLRTGSVKVVFAVDLYNEGVDIPDVDTLLMLRPTESPTLFLQQLGRGLRRTPDKSLCTVLDFIGNHRKEFRFDRKYRALIGGGRRNLQRAIEGGFPFLPAGSHLELDKVSQTVVLQSLKNAIPSTRPAIVQELGAHAAAGDTSLRQFLEESGLDLDDIYTNSFIWSDLREHAGLPVEPAGPKEQALRRAISRMLHIDDDVRVGALIKFLAAPTPPDVARLSPIEQRLIRMFISSFGPEVLTKGLTTQAAIDLVWDHPQVRADLGELLPVLADRAEHLYQPVGLPDVPMQVHARYTRGEILAAVGEGAAAAPRPWREGVYHARAIRADLLAFTLDKTSGRFSPTTRYRDYAISRELIHWESQSTTAADSEAGRRYRNHVARGSSILLFARERTDERGFYFLGPAQYVSHEGERPMAITWSLHVPLPGDLFEAFAAAVA